MLFEQREHPRRRGSSSDAGQMVVELCAVVPVIVMVAVLVLDSLVYAASCSGFDHLAAQGALSVAGAPAGTEFSAQQAAQDLQTRLQEGRGERERVEVEASELGTLCLFTCRLSVTPWPLAAPGQRVFSMSVPLELEHSFSFAVRPYVIGAL